MRCTSSTLSTTGRVALFSTNKWSCFRLSKFWQGIQNGLVSDQQMALFSLDKNNQDGNRNNNRFTNLVLLHGHCHDRVHGKWCL